MKIARALLLLVAAVALLAAPAQKKAAPARQPAPAAASQAKSGGLIDINSASEKELKELPGIGDAYAAKIIANRPYRAKNQLVQKHVIPEATYEKIRDRIVARQKK